MAGHLPLTRLAAPDLTHEEREHLERCDQCALGRAFPPVLERITAGPRRSVAHVELVLGGFALPGVPLASGLASYTIDLVPDDASSDATVSVEVSPLGTWLRPLAPGVRLDARPVAVGDARALTDGDVVQSSSGTLRFVTASPGYAGLLLSDTGWGFGAADGTTVELGRQPNQPGLALPERHGLDRTLVGRRHAAIAVEGGEVRLVHLHARFPTWLVRSGSSDLEPVPAEAALRSGDRVVIGTSVVLVRNM